MLLVTSRYFPYHYQTNVSNSEILGQNAEMLSQRKMSDVYTNDHYKF